VADTGLQVMADESMTDRQSLERLIAAKACTAVNVRISKCGGLRAARKRCREILNAGLVLQIGCQVGESSLLSAVNMLLLSEVAPVKYAEGCYGLHLLKLDPVKPVLQFGQGGKIPGVPKGNGFGVLVDETILKGLAVRQLTVA
jgi:muconate cycloisomerase